MKAAIFILSVLCALAVAQQTSSETCPTIVCPNSKAASGKVSVQGTGSLTLTPDEAFVEFTIELTRNNATRARADAAQVTNSTTNAILKNSGISPSDIKTTSINLDPKYSYSNVTKLIGYQFSQTIIVNIKNLTADLLSNVIDSAVTAGGNYLRVGSVSTDLGKETKANAVNEARKAAVTSALQTASVVAGAANVTLGPVISIVDQSSVPVPVPSPSMPAGYGVGAAAAAKEPAKTPVSLGKMDVQATVAVDMAICSP